MDGRFYRRNQLERIWREDDEHRYGDLRLVRTDVDREHDEAAAGGAGRTTFVQFLDRRQIGRGLELETRVERCGGGDFLAAAELRHSEPIRPSGERVWTSDTVRSRGHETVEAAVAALAALESEVMTNAGSVATG